MLQNVIHTTTVTSLLQTHQVFDWQEMLSRCIRRPDRYTSLCDDVLSATSQVQVGCI